MTWSGSSHAVTVCGVWQLLWGTKPPHAGAGGCVPCLWRNQGSRGVGACGTLSLAAESRAESCPRPANSPGNIPGQVRCASEMPDQQDVPLKDPFQPKLFYDSVVSGTFIAKVALAAHYWPCARSGGEPSPDEKKKKKKTQQQQKTKHPKLWKMVGNCCFKTKSGPRHIQLHSHPKGNGMSRNWGGGHIVIQLSCLALSWASGLAQENVLSTFLSSFQRQPGCFPPMRRWEKEGKNDRLVKGAPCLWQLADAQEARLAKAALGVPAAS